jgi:hypothetical protein
MLLELASICYQANRLPDHKGQQCVNGNYEGHSPSQPCRMGLEANLACSGSKLKNFFYALGPKRVGSASPSRTQGTTREPNRQRRQSDGNEQSCTFGISHQQTLHVEGVKQQGSLMSMLLELATRG